MDLSSRDSAIKFGMGRYRQAPGLLEQLGDELARFGDKALVIAGERSWEAVKDRLVPVLEESAIEVSLAIWKGACCAEGARELSGKAKEIGASQIIGIGGGKIIDLAKATAELSGVGATLIPTNVAQCAPGACTSVMYTPDGAKDVTWRYGHEVNGCYIDLDVIAQCPPRYLAAGVVDAMAKKIEILNGRPDLELASTDIDLYTAYNLACYTYDVLDGRWQQAIEDNRAGRVTKALEDVVFAAVPVTGVISNTTRGYNQTQIAHVIYDGVRTLFTEEAKQSLHGEIVAVGLFCQLYFNGLEKEEDGLKNMLRSMEMPLTLPDLGIDAKEENLEALERYIAGSRHFNDKDPDARKRLHRAMLEMI